MGQPSKPWTKILKSLRQRRLPEPLGIYGAGFYGSVIATRLTQKAECFIDINPYLQGLGHLNIQVVSTENCPKDVASIFIGLNPKRAREILGENPDWKPKDAALIHLDGKD
ncbi:MAG: hypothetical protein QNK92_00465 [Amylibacter sp.]